MGNQIAVIVGSLRRESLNRRTAEALIEAASPAFGFDFVEIGDLPLFNEDLDLPDSVPAAWSAFRAQIKGYTGVLFVTPEYNRSIPAALKNALDVGSRPYGQNVFDAKPCAVVSVSPGAMGGFGANQHLRQVVSVLNMPCMPQPEVYLGGAGRLFDAQGKLGSDSTREFLGKFMRAFALWVERNSV